MRTELYLIEGNWPGRLAIAPRPRGGDWLEEELRSWARSGVQVVVSLLTPDEVMTLDLAQESSLCRAEGIEYVSFPITDRGLPPSREGFTGLVTRLSERLLTGDRIAIHCRQGIGRAALVAIGVLISLDLSTEEAVRRVATARGCAVPETPDQQKFVTEFAQLRRVAISQTT